MYKLINSVKSQTQHVENLCENCVAAPVDTAALFEAADKLLGNTIASLKSGKNPFETMPGSRDVVAGLMLLAKNTNREALNLTPKKFNLISQDISDKKIIQKYVANLAQKYGPSLIKNLDAYVIDNNRREVLIRKLVQIQSEYSRAKQKVNQDDNIRQTIAA